MSDYTYNVKLPSGESRTVHSPTPLSDFQAYKAATTLKVQPKANMQQMRAALMEDDARSQPPENSQNRQVRQAAYKASGDMAPRQTKPSGFDKFLDSSHEAIQALRKKDESLAQRVGGGHGGPLKDVGSGIADVLYGLIDPKNIVEGTGEMMGAFTEPKNIGPMLKSNFGDYSSIQAGTRSALNTLMTVAPVVHGVKGKIAPHVEGIADTFAEGFNHPNDVVGRLPEAAPTPVDRITSTPIPDSNIVNPPTVEPKPAQVVDTKKTTQPANELLTQLVSGTKEEAVAKRPLPYKGYEPDTVETLSKNLPDTGKPGYSKEGYYVSTNAKIKNTPADFGDAVNYVYRDEKGEPVGVLNYLKGGEGQEPSFTVAVKPEFQRQGIATKLYDMAEADGLPVNELIGKGGLTEEGAAFHYGRAQKKAASLPDVRDFTQEHATQIDAVPSAYEDAATTANRTVPELAAETRQAARTLEEGAPGPGGVVPGAEPGGPSKPPKAPDVSDSAAAGGERPQQELTGLARRFDDAERAHKGLPPTERAARSLQAIADEGEKLIKNGDIDPAAVVAKSIKTGQGLTPEEVAAVGHQKITLANRYDALLKKLEDAKLDPSERLDIMDERDKIERQLEDISYAAQNTRTTWHEGGMALQIARTRDFKVGSVLGEAKAVNLGEELPQVYRDKLTFSASKIKQMEGTIATLRNELELLYKNKAKTVGVRSKDAAVRSEALAKRISQRLGIAEGTASGSGFKSKKAGAFTLPQSDLKLLAQDTRALAKSFIESGQAHNLDGVLDGLKKAVPGMAEDDWLSLLSGSYREAVLSADIQKLSINKAMRSLAQSAKFREKSLTAKAIDIATEVVQGFSRPFKAGFDISILNVQGSKAKFTNPGAWLKAWVPQFKAIMGGEDAVLRIHAERMRDPLFAKAKQAKLDLLDMDGGYQSHEESFANRLVEILRNADTGKKGLDVPAKVAGEGMYRSEASATEALNDLRWQMFKKFAKAGPQDAEFLADAARMINVSTGRPIGRLREITLNRAAGNSFFAPGYWASKYQYATFEPLRTATTWKGRGHIAIAYGKHLGGLIVTAYAIDQVLTTLKDKDGKSLGGVQMDPRHSDFGKVYAGDYSADLFGIDGEPVRVVTQMLAGKISQKGKYTKPSLNNAIQVAGQSVTNKFAPLPRLIKTVAAGTIDNDSGEPRPFEPKDIAQSFEPMAIEKMHQGGFSPYMSLNILTDVDNRRMKDAIKEWEWIHAQEPEETLLTALPKDDPVVQAFLKNEVSLGMPQQRKEEPAAMYHARVDSERTAIHNAIAKAIEQDDYKDGSTEERQKLLRSIVRHVQAKFRKPRP